MRAEKLEYCPDCGTDKEWRYDAQRCEACENNERKADVSDSFGARLKIALSVVGTSQSERAKRTGLLPSNVSHFIRGQREPSLEVLARIVIALPKIDVRWLVTGRKD